MSKTRHLFEIPIKDSGTLKRKIIIVKDHNFSLLAWFVNKQDDSVYNLVEIDNHFDYAEISEEILQSYRGKQINYEELCEMTLKSEFLRLARELRIINKIWFISPKEAEDMGDFVEWWSNIPSFLSDNKGIMDRCDPEINEIREQFCSGRVILDIDLDYFTYEHNNERYMIHNNAMDTNFDDPSLPVLLSIPSIITIAMEEHPFVEDNFDNTFNSLEHLLSGLQKYIQFEYVSNELKDFLKYE